MAITDNFSGSITTMINFALSRSVTDGADFSGVDRMKNTYTHNFTNGAGVDQATIMLTGQGTVTQAGAITLSLADSVNPLSTISNNVPSEDPEGLKIRMLLITNLDDTNYIFTAAGVNPLVDITANRIYPGGIFVWVAPAGGDPIADGVDDELTLRADTADCEARIDVIYG